MRSIVIGASGQVGSELYEYLSLDKDNHVFGTSYSSHVNFVTSVVDITNYKEVTELISALHPDIIYLPAAVTNVDLCSEKPEETYHVNVLGIKNVVDAIGSRPIKLVYFSSDFVFDGIEGFYSEDAIPNPINEYGRQKLLAEHYIMGHMESFKIIRSNVIFGPDPQNKNFVVKLIENLRAGKVVNIPMDEYGTPTYGPALVETVVDVISKNPKNGIYHVGGSKMISRYKFALEAADVFDCDRRLIKPITSISLGRKALRPLNAGLNCDDGGCFTIDYIQGLRRMAAEVEV